MPTLPSEPSEPSEPIELVRRTPLIPAPAVGEGVYLKLESQQRTGSFKLRGAVNACRLLTESERARGVIVASAGNHGAAMALATQSLSIALEVVVPKGTPKTKLAKINAAGASITVFDGNYDEAEAHAIESAAKSCTVFVSAFDDERVIAGNGDSLALEVLDQCTDIATIVAPIGGGGMIAGLARTLAPAGVVVVGAQPRNNCAMHDSLAAGRPLVDYVGESTIAEGCEGAVGSLAFSIAAPHINSVALVSEDEIEEGVRVAYNALGLVVESSGAVGLAALLSRSITPRGTTVCIISGGNIDDVELDRILRHRPRG